MMPIFCDCLLSRTHANGSIKRGNKDNATDSVSLRTGIGVQLKDIKVFNRARQQGEQNIAKDYFIVAFRGAKNTFYTQVQVIKYI